MIRLCEKIISLIIAPLFVGLVIVLVDHWLDG
ncbi:type I toxin-antitoxin system Fst family toxin [Tetragenococcus koreensis]|nr:type I toxin-antitoxin system Fst family toxin [Tetragenococcus koreensis]MCF1630475.1 type I toxin-antitoxin system Fst family toxin [Tetragenococcus koreensis]